MEQKRLLNLLNESIDSKFTTRNQKIANDQSNANYDVRNETIYNTEVLKYNLCDYKDPYILLRGDITFAAAGETQVVLKNCAPFAKSITKIYEITIDDAEDLDLADV